MAKEKAHQEFRARLYGVRASKMLKNRFYFIKSFIFRNYQLIDRFLAKIYDRIQLFPIISIQLNLYMVGAYIQFSMPIIRFLERVWGVGAFLFPTSNMFAKELICAQII
jgi:hypothetical protein